MVAMGREKTRHIRLMVVEDDPGVGYAVSRWLQEHEVRSVLATSTGEAMEMLRDIIFIEAAFDALLVDYNLPDATGVRVIQEFRDEFPTVPVALMTGNDDISLEVWTKARKIPLFKKPLKMDEVSEWIEGIRQTA
jgi:DNA-binding response OmpR family regulator